MDQQPPVSPHSFTHSGSSAGGGSKTSTLRSKLEGELNFKSKTLSYKSPSPGPPSCPRRRTVSSNQAPSEDTIEPPGPVVPEIPVAPVFTPPRSKNTKKATKENKASRKEEEHKEKPTEVALKVCILKGINVCRVHLWVCVCLCVSTYARAFMQRAYVPMHNICSACIDGCHNECVVVGCPYLHRH